MFPKTVQLLKKKVYNRGAAQLFQFYHYYNRRLASFYRLRCSFFLQNPEIQKMQLKGIILNLEFKMALFEITHFF